MSRVCQVRLWSSRTHGIRDRFLWLRPGPTLCPPCGPGVKNDGWLHSGLRCAGPLYGRSWRPAACDEAVYCRDDRCPSMGRIVESAVCSLARPRAFTCCLAQAGQTGAESRFNQGPDCVFVQILSAKVSNLVQSWGSPGFPNTPRTFASTSILRGWGCLQKAFSLLRIVAWSDFLRR